MTWVIAMVAVVTALASANNGVPSPRTQMKSSNARSGNVHLAAHQVVHQHGSRVGRPEAQGPALPPLQARSRQ